MGRFLTFSKVRVVGGVVLGVGYNAVAGTRSLWPRLESGLGGRSYRGGVGRDVSVDEVSSSGASFRGQCDGGGTDDVMVFISESAGLSHVTVEIFGGRSVAEIPCTDDEQHNLTWVFQPIRGVWWCVFVVVLGVVGLGCALHSVEFLGVSFLLVCVVVAGQLVHVVRNAGAFGVPRIIMWKKCLVLGLGQLGWAGVLFLVASIVVV